jgi:folate-dependent tRNA-U54 methylase TrmFO/GidA
MANNRVTKRFGKSSGKHAEGEMFFGKLFSYLTRAAERSLEPRRCRLGVLENLSSRDSSQREDEDPEAAFVFSSFISWAYNG